MPNFCLTATDNVHRQYGTYKCLGTWNAVSKALLCSWVSRANIGHEGMLVGYVVWCGVRWGGQPDLEPFAPSCNDGNALVHLDARTCTLILMSANTRHDLHDRVVVVVF